jgi:hypothetical protein
MAEIDLAQVIQSARQHVLYAGAKVDGLGVDLEKANVHAGIATALSLLALVEIIGGLREAIFNYLYPAAVNVAPAPLAPGGENEQQG